MNLDSNLMKDVGMEHGKLLGKGKKGHKLEAASFHLTDRACVCVWPGEWFSQLPKQI